MIDNGVPREIAIENPAIAEQLRDFVREALAREETVILQPARMLVAEPGRGEWLRQVDRSQWYYWPALRDYLLVTKNWLAPSVRSLDEITNRIVAQLAPPETEQFDIRGLVLGFVQSGKTANFTALIAKVADLGYRLIIVLSGTDNGLRRQTQIRLNRELVGYSDNRPGAVTLPPMGRRWHQFTSEELNGDFRPGFANYGALQGSEPVLLVVKKNGPVLRRLHAWLDAAPEDARRVLPVLIIDDEADQASVDTRGSYQAGDDPDDPDYEPPTIINGLIRDLLRKFQRTAYVAYTATPFANVLIPHDTVDPSVGNDLYPRDFIVDLPKPDGYFGAEELFGRLDPVTGERVEGLDVVREVTDEDILVLNQGALPSTLETAILDFILAGAARAERGQADLPATMLIHTSSRIAEQRQLAVLVVQQFGELRDEWRYQRGHSIRDRLRQHWDSTFRLVTRARHAELDRPFDRIEEHIGPFFESIEVRVINSETGEVLDYEREPGLKAIAIGGNRLSRGLTLEGLMESYFARRSGTYDTLMQMGRWFGFRNGYEDLTRIYMTDELAGWFSDLALVEHQLREDIQVYESQSLTPMQLGTRILEHPAMLVTSRLKQRFATTITVEQSYSAQVVQTVRFPFRRPDYLNTLLDENLQTARRFLQSLGSPRKWARTGPVWQEITAEAVLEFLQTYRVDPESRNISLPLLSAYIERQNELGELQNWTVAVKGLQSLDRSLGDLDLGVGGLIHQVGRTRLASDLDSLGVLTSPGDEEEGLSPEELNQAHSLQETERLGANPAARRVRLASEGLLLLYPISRHSGHDLREGASRRRLFENPDDLNARDVLGLAISFPHSDNAQRIVGQYVVGTVGWRAV
ncbi:MAG TPA: Z1 domain-containing protein [Pyrinomonadaceae bacterium]|nr:Z1 domain-containing protein [Pyrinomonadaceae bacterium]